MPEKIIGRERERQKISKILASKSAEFIAVYGRRRVGKTYLIRNTCQEQGLYFELVGSKDSTLAEQLQNFTEVFSNLFHQGLSLERCKSWRSALGKLNDQIEKLPKDQNIVLFFDELPWLAAKRSRFMQALDYIWNKYWSQDPRVKLIVCGSAASWMIDNLINAKGGLYNRVTNIILLKPFDLRETENYLLDRGVKFNQRQLLEVYMVMGGIPYYLNQLEKQKSSAQNIDNICFKQEGVLFSEFDRLFSSLFNYHEQNLAIVLELSKHQQGISREYLLGKLQISSGGSFKKRIAELESSGFVQTFIPYGNAVKNQCYKIIDEYTLFYLRWIRPVVSRVGLNSIANYWLSKANTPEWFAWAGYAFENICYKHTAKILRALELDNISCEVGTWRLAVKPGSVQRGAQIDLIIDRADGVISLCEIKFTQDEFVIDRDYASKLLHKIETFKQHFKTHKNLQLVMITSAGLKQNAWAEDLVSASVKAEDL